MSRAQIRYGFIADCRALGFASYNDSVSCHFIYHNFCTGVNQISLADYVDDLTVNNDLAGR